LLKSVPDGVTCPQSDPLRDRPVLLLSFGELLLRAEGLVALLNVSSASILQIVFNAIFIHHPPSGASDRSFIPKPSHRQYLRDNITGRTYRHRDDCRVVEFVSTSSSSKFPSRISKSCVGSAKPST
jgi:hypothetical protein